MRAFIFIHTKVIEPLPYHLKPYNPPNLYINL